MAQTKYNFSNYSFTDSYGETFSPVGPFYHVSANGQYAVGCDDIEMSYGESFLWDKSNPNELTLINASSNRISAQDVSNDGIVVGSFENREDEDTKAICYPGFRTLDGTWTALPVPDEYDLSQAKSYNYMEEARAITPDAKYIAGNVHYVVGYNSTWGWSISYLTPILWEKTDDGYVMKNVYLNLGDEGKSKVYDNGELKTVDHAVNYKTFVVYDISDDGSVIVGVNTAGSGGQNPAIIKNGELIQLFDCGGDVDDANNFNGGVCNSIDANGNVYGYYQNDDATEIKYFVYTTEGNLEYFDKQVFCATKDGQQVTSETVDLYSILDCSDDGSVIVGGGIASTGWGGSYNTPALVVGAITTAVDRLDAIKNNIGIDYRRGGMLYINGEYLNADVYSASGALVASGKQGKAFNTAGLAGGTYVVKVTTANGVKTFKFAK